jgi:phage tail-like protein
MADSKDIQKKFYPLPAYNYRVQVGDTVMSFSGVSGISHNFDKVTYRTGLSAWEGEAIRTFNFGSFSSVTMTRGVILGKDPLALYNWLQQGDVRSLQVSLCDEKGETVISWKFEKAVPVKLSAPGFDAKTNEPAIESVELAVSEMSMTTP